MRRWNLFWAVVLIVVGALMLLDNLGLVRFDPWMIIGPGFLVALGLWILLERPVRTHTVEGESLSIPLQNASRAEVAIRHGAGRLSLNGGAAADELLSGSFAGGVGQYIHLEGDVLKVSLTGPHDFFAFPRPGGSWREGLNWDMALNAGIPLSLDCRTGASESTFDLKGLKVSEFDLRCGASEVTLWLPAAAGYSRFRIRGGMGSIKVHAPKEVAVRISVSSGMSEVSIYPARFPRRDDVHESPDFSTAANKVELHIRAGMSSIEVV